MNRTRGSSHGGWVKKKREKKEEVEGNKRDLKNNIRRKWIQTRWLAPANPSPRASSTFSPPLSTFLASIPSPSSFLLPPFLLPVGRRVAWLEIKHIHHRIRVHCLLSINKLRITLWTRSPLLLLLPFSTFLFHDGRAPRLRNNCGARLRERALSLFDGLVVNAPGSRIPPRWNSIRDRFAFLRRLAFSRNRVVNSWRENFDGGEKKEKEKKGRAYIYILMYFHQDGCFARKGQVERFSSERQRTMDQRVP